MTSSVRPSASLPIYEHQDAIIAAVRDHRVVVIEGPTGCGKTTQLPQMLLRAGIAPRCIGVTQPRRIAAVSVAWRIAEEMGCAIGTDVGYAIRFDDRTSANTAVKVMTDGILLQEARSDDLFQAYDIIMVDEAHERSLNIDLILGLLHRALRRRDDLRVVVSSATLEPERFQRFFASAVGTVPLVSASARTHPVQVLYRPPVDPETRGSLAEAVAEEVVRLHRSGESGHILAFLTGEGMIRDAERAIDRLHPGSKLLVMPLFGRLTREEQERVFDDVGDYRKAVLATNIAETSITIPDVRYVIDTGLAKLPRFDTRTGITTLREELISTASVDQRTGRAGRTQPGVVVRLYPERTMGKRPRFTEPEVLRQDLCELVLRLIDLGITEIEEFPLPTSIPGGRRKAALETLTVLGAIDGERRLTEVGHRMVPFPLEPRLARMIVEATTRFPSVTEDVLIAGAFLSSRPPYLFPAGEEMEARAAHDRLGQRHGDAATAVATYRAWRRANDRQAFCARNFLDPDTMGFVAKTVEQLAEIAAKQGVEMRAGGSSDDLNRAVAAGFPDRILIRRGRHFELPNGARISIHPSSSLFGTRRPCVMAAELIRSTRIYARQVSSLEPQWLHDISPRAAAMLPGADKKTRHERTPAAERAPLMPAILIIGGTELLVRVRRQDVKVDVPMHALPALREVSLRDLPEQAWQCKVRVGEGRDRYLRDLTLAELVAVLPHIALPDGEPAGANSVPQGALLDAERNLHTLVRFLPQVMDVVRPRRGKHPGWVALVTNGADGFWYEVTPSLQEALALSSEALEALVDTLPDEDRAKPKVIVVAERVQAQRRSVDDALARARQLRPKKR